jgi:hypothetical protein
VNIKKYGRLEAKREGQKRDEVLPDPEIHDTLPYECDHDRID